MKILIIGCGSIGARHAANAVALAETAVFDPNNSLSHQVSAKTGAKVFTSLEDALAWGPDGAVIATPNHTHLPVAQKAIEAGVDVLIEKPLAPDMEGVDAFKQSVSRSGKDVWVVCNMRYHPAVMALHSQLESIGRPLFARAHVGNYLPNMRPGIDYRSLYCANRDQGGGVILDAIHEVDYLMWFFGGVEDVACTADRLSNLDIDVEDFACLCLTHKRGTVSEIQMDYLRPFKRRGCEIVGERGMLLWESEGKAPERCVVRIFNNDTQNWKTIYETDCLDTAAPYVTLMKTFIDAISGNKTTLLGLNTAAEEVAVVLRALKKSGLRPH